MKDMIGPAGSAPDEEPPTTAAGLTIILVPCALVLPRHGRKLMGGRRWRVARVRTVGQAVALEQSRGSAVSALAESLAYEAPSSAAELTIILVPCTLGPPGYGRKRGHGSRTRPWTRPPGAGPP